MSNTTNPVRVCLFALQEMTHSTDFLGLKGARATTLKGNILVYMAWCDLEGAFVSLTTPD